MGRFDWRDARWRRWGMAALTFIAVMSIAMHPELRVLAPILNAVGLDVFVALLGARLAMYLKPATQYLYIRCVRPALLWLDRATAALPLVRELRRFHAHLLQTGSGYLGQYAWVLLQQSMHRLRMGPGPSLERVDGTRGIG